MVLRVKKNLYIEAAVVNGTRTWKILLVHVLPNMVTQMVVTAAADIGTMMLELASLSFLGFGATAPTPEWGTDAERGKNLHGKSTMADDLPRYCDRDLRSYLQHAW